MRRIEEIMDQITEYHPGADLDLVQRAYVFSARAHQGQVRMSGEPYLSHPLEVAGILTDMKLDVATVTTGLLHDTVEDTSVTLETIEEVFGKEVSIIVDGVTKISQIQFASHAERQAENMRKMILAMATDIRVILVKLADRLHNMRTLGHLAETKQSTIAKETLEIYSPLAGRLGIHKIQSELEDLCLYTLEPETYEEIRSGVARRRGERTQYIREVVEVIEKKVNEFGINTEIFGRPKHLYSIYKKMVQQNLTIDQVYDIIAFRIVVDSVRDCYAVLGVIHSIFKPIPGRFKDYISLPKANGYQSLHTAVIGPRAERMEVQIRTREMNNYAENGIAAHWRYKEGDKLTDTESDRFQWLRSLLEWQRELKDPTEFMTSVRDSLQTEDKHVYVFTPAGEVKELPKGATPIDFAYAIHTQVGHHCSGAKVNGSIVAVKYHLQNGDTIEILTNKNGTPSKDWLNFVVTSKARTRIRQWFKTVERERALSLGREMVEKEFRKESLGFNQVMKEVGFEKVATDFSLLSAEDLFVTVGFGKISPKQVAGRFKHPEEEPTLVDRVVRRILKKPKHGIKVKGVGDILVRFAKCCNPLPGEAIVGYITQGRGVAVHTARCRSLDKADPQRLVDVEWDLEVGVTYPVRIQVVTLDRPGILAELSGAIAESKANITQALVEVTPEQKGVGEFTIEVTGRDHLRQVIANLKKLKWVERVSRIGAQNLV
ncbi:MAG: bifunctional (p)ppGpp synthetase/guanosine-3',5'-bis(diphosphate) 3'-pyrophosphohydrolase [Thermodesulfobacteriota bacterium]